MRLIPILSVLALCAGCATAPEPVAQPVAAARPAATDARCTPPATRPTFATWCDLPADVRAYVDDRDTCAEYRAAPWPSSESEDDRRQRQAIVEGLRTSCAGLETRLADLRKLHADNGPIGKLLAAYSQAK